MSMSPETRGASEEPLESRLSAALSDLGIGSGGAVHVEVDDAVVRLRGRVFTFYAKQIAYHTATRLAGERRIVDELEVVERLASRAATARMLRTATTAVATALIAATIGCSKSEPDRVPVHPVTGQVTFDGKPASGAFVVFHPKNAEIGFPSPRAQVDAQGNYALTTYTTSDGAPAGEYVVTVVLQPMVQEDGEYKPGRNILPPRISKPDSSDIAALVTEGPNTVPITIAR